MEHIWTSEDGVRWRNTPDRVYCYVNFAGRGFEIDMGVPDKRDREILRLAERLQALETVAGEDAERRGAREESGRIRSELLKTRGRMSDMESRDRLDFLRLEIDRIIPEGE